MNLDGLTSFLAMVDAGSLAGASRALGVSRATLRRRLTDLETQVGVSLLVRTRDEVRLTPAGNVLRTEGRVVLQEARAVMRALGELHTAPSGVIRMVAPVGLPPEFIAMVLTRARDRFPELTLHVRFHEDPPSQSLEDTDLTVHFGQQVPRGPWLTATLLRMPQRAVAVPSYLARHGTPVTLDDLARHTLMSWQPPGEDGRSWPLRAGGSHPVSPMLTTPDAHLVRRCAQLGMGIGFVPDGNIPDPFTDEPLVDVLPETLGSDCALRILIPEALADVPRFQLARAFIRECIAAL